MIQLDDLKICDTCGNTFAKTLAGKAINRCPACKTWKINSEDQEEIMLNFHKFIQWLFHHNVETKHHWWKEQ